MDDPLPERPGLIAEFETPPGQAVLPEVHVALRLDGDRFGRLRARPDLRLEAPFDARFGKWVLQVASAVLREHPQARFAYVGDDEISVLFGRGAEGFGPGGFRFAIRVAAQASGQLSLLIGQVATYGPRVFQLPTDDWAVRYFAWRQAVILSQSLDRYCRAALSLSGLDEAASRRVLAGLSDVEKQEVLSEHGIDVAAAPTWQRRGVLVWRKPGGEGDAALVIDTELPDGEAFERFVRRVAAT
jgi:tRNA(His) 5'-end guanylyltransferase